MNKWITTKKPLPDGYYFCRRIDGVDEVLNTFFIRDVAEGIIYQCGSKVGFNNFEDYEWFGPIRLPT